MLRLFFSVICFIVITGGFLLLGNLTLAQNVKPNRAIAQGKSFVRFECRAATSRIDDFLTAAGVTGGVLIAEKGKVILRKGYGWADEERKIPLTTRSAFDIGSDTKQFTPAAILKLEEQGKIKGTDPITKFFKDVPKII